MSNLNVLGDVIRTEREKRALSQEALASLSGLSRSHVGEIERGDVSVSFAALESIALGLGVSLRKIVSAYERQSSQRHQEIASSS